MCRNYLFIGGGGFIGSNIIRGMIGKGSFNQIIVVEPHNSNTDRIEDLPITIIRGELYNVQLIEDVIIKNNIDTIVHLVSTMIPGSLFEDYIREFHKVILPTIKLIQLCCSRRIRFVFFSSGGTIYGDRKNLRPFKESDQKEPISYYGMSKLVIENNILYAHRTNGLEYLIFRPSNPYGKGQNIKGCQGLIAISIGKILNNLPIQIWGDGNSVRDYIYIEDLANICISFLTTIKKSNMILNIGSGIGYSINQIIEFLKNVSQLPVRVEYHNCRRVDVANMILDNSQVLSMLSDIKLTPIEIGIRKFYNYEKMKNENDKKHTD